METGLQLLMRDGAVRVAFHPRLTVDQYAEFLQLLDDTPTRAELCVVGADAAKRWGVEFICENVGV
jgi:hypothetical protein